MRNRWAASPVITGPSAAPIILNGYEASCPRAMLTTTAAAQPRYRWVDDVPLYRTGDLELSRDHPDIDWEAVHAVKPRVTRSIEIDAPVEEVFGFVSNPQRRMQALATALDRRIVVSEIETSPDGAVTSWRWSTRFVLPFDYHVVATRTEHIASRRIVEKHATATRDVDAFTFEPSGKGTRLTYYAECSSPIPLLEKVGILLAAKGRGHGRQIEDFLAGVKQRMEAEAGSAPTR